MSWTQTQSRRALQGTIAVYSVPVPDNSRDVDRLYASIEPELHQRIEQYMIENSGVKVQVCAWVKFFKPTLSEVMIVRLNLRMGCPKLAMPSINICNVDLGG